LGPPAARMRAPDSSSTAASLLSGVTTVVDSALDFSSLIRSSSSLSCTTARTGFPDPMHLRTPRLNSGLTSSIGPTSSMTITSDPEAAASSPAAPTAARSTRLTLYLPTFGPTLGPTDASSPFRPVVRSVTSNPTLVPLDLTSEVEHPPTTTPALLSFRTTLETTVDLPAPGGPVTSQMPANHNAVPGRGT
jgi:hypothetical protein